MQAEGGLGIPVVQIIIEGGYDVLVLAGYSVEHNISIVVCSGTGRAANLLDAAIRFRGQEPGFEDFTPVQKKQLERLLQGLMDKEKARSLEPGLELLRQIVQHPNLLNRVDLGQSTDLDSVILYALIKTSVEPFDQIHIALKFDRELFIWAIFFNRPKMVDLFWRLAREPVALGLIGCNLYDNIGKCLPLYDTDGQLYMQSQKLKMETATLQVVDRCYAASHGMTTYLLDRRSEDTDGCTCTELAAQAHCLKFMSSVSCQYAVDFAWCAGVKANGFVIILAYFCPLLLLSDKLFIFCTESAILEDDNDYEEASRLEMKPLASTSTHGTETPGEEADDRDDADNEDGDYTKDGRLKFYVRLQRFYTAPRTKFYVHFFAYIAFLIFYAYVLLFALYPDHLSICEMVLMVCLGTFFVETIRSMIKSAQQPGTYKSRPCKWLTSYSWHAYDIFLNLTNITGVLLRIGLETTFIYAKSVSAVSYILFFVRLFQHYSVNHKLGPKIQMIVQMFKELLIFMVILAVFLVSSGVAMQSLLYPYRTEFNASVLLDVVYIPYYRIYGELNLDEANETIQEIDQEVEYMQRWAVLKIAEEEENSTHESVEGRLKSIQTT
ncbi:unnamed protein product [Dibothriocephalus latus]|uniref:TRPM SLOG domain-containing protein n=1 Tax=Dibothriocephalus latus TaxID=60516 RepID=A0A3P6T1U6_DIBLA|nr:unnamed protein product [Dibothriocephalus latus]